MRSRRLPGSSSSFLERARRALGDPAVDPDARVLTDEELELARHAKTLLDAGLDEESFFELIRVMSHSLDSIASALVATLGQALLQPGDTERDLGLRYAESLRMLAPLAGPALELILNRRLREQIRDAVIGRAELESGRLPGAQYVFVAFVDIVGFTRARRAGAGRRARRRRAGLRAARGGRGRAARAAGQDDR